MQLIFSTLLNIVKFLKSAFHNIKKYELDYHLLSIPMNTPTSSKGYNLPVIVNLG